MLAVRFSGAFNLKTIDMKLERKKHRELTEEEVNELRRIYAEYRKQTNSDGIGVFKLINKER